VTTHHHPGGGASTFHALSRVGASLIKHGDNLILILPKYILQCFRVICYIKRTCDMYIILKDVEIHLKL
jgi:hypothetical protein